MKKIRNSLFIKLTVFLLIILSFYILFFFILDYNAGRMLKENTENMNEKILSQIDGKIRDIYEFTNDVAIAFAYSPSVYDYFTQSPTERVVTLQNLEIVEINTMLLQKEIFGVCLYDKERKLIASIGGGITEPPSDTIETDKMKISNIVQGMFPYYMVYFPVFDLHSRQYGEQIGTCVFYMRRNLFDAYLDDAQATDHTEVYLLDGNGYVIAQAGGESCLNYTSEMEQMKDHYFIQEKELIVDGWRIVSRIPEAEMNLSRENLLTYIYICFLTALLFFGLFVLMGYHYMILPLRRVDLFLNKIIDYPEERMQAEHQDEIGNVIQSLNHMLDEKERLNQEIQESQRKIYESELSKKQLQLLALRGQINPHFLYNTFDCIRSMALYYDADCIAEITMALSHVFRFAVKGENLVSVEEELEYIREYAKIIHFRFNGKIRIQVEAEEQTLKKNVIKLLLQPLVENAVIHGIENKVNGGEINVAVREADHHRLLFIIKDDGCGIPAKKQEEIWKSLSETTEQNGVGITNIYQRLQLFYGNQMQFTLNSEEGKGTEIIIEIPETVEEWRNRNVYDISGR